MRYFAYVSALTDADDIRELLPDIQFPHVSDLYPTASAAWKAATREANHDIADYNEESDEPKPALTTQRHRFECLGTSYWVIDLEVAL